MTKTINFTNEKGNAIPSMQRMVKSQVKEQFFKDFKEGENGKMYIKVATDSNTGKPVYAVCEIVATINPSLEKEKRKSRAKANVEIPNLFE